MLELLKFDKPRCLETPLLKRKYFLHFRVTKRDHSLLSNIKARKLLMSELYKISMEGNIAFLERISYPRFIIKLDCTKPIFEILDFNLLDTCSSEEIHDAINELEVFIRNLQR